MKRMMRVCFWLFWVLAGQIRPLYAQAQLQATPQLSVTYSQRLSGQDHAPATLVARGSASLYYYNRSVTQPGNALRQTDDTHYVLEATDAEGFCIYRELATGELLGREFDFATKQFVLVPDSVPQLKWQIGTATRQIGQYQTQQATVSFRGRQYEAWFTPDIPIPLGPWKLGGLPGLILEVHDATGQVAFAATLVAQPSTVQTLVVPPTQGKRYSNWADYQAYVAQANRRLAKFMQAQTPGLNVTISRSEALELAP